LLGELFIFLEDCLNSHLETIEHFDTLSIGLYDGQCWRGIFQLLQTSIIVTICA